MAEEKDPFCLEWQELSLQEVLSENFSANENADVLRAMLLNVECARAGGMYALIDFFNTQFLRHNAQCFILQMACYPWLI